MTDQEYADDSQKMILQMLLLEFRIDHVHGRRIYSDEAWLKSLESFNLGREILDRKFLKIFFGGGPKGINKRIRVALINLMLKIDKEYPELKGENFDFSLKELLRKNL